MLKKLTTAAVTGALMLPTVGAAAAAADATPQKAKAAGAPKSAVAAARAVDDASEVLARRYTSLDCRVSVTQLGAEGILECIGSSRAKKALGKKIRRMIRNDEIIRPEAGGYYVGVWTQNSQRVVRIDWARWGRLGTPI
jgi:hypothetical protein